MAQQHSPILGWEAEGSANKWLVLVSVMIGTFMAVLDATIVSVAFPKMMAVFGVSVDQIEWVMTAYMLAFAVVLPSSGWIADRFGYKFTFILGLALFTVGSFACSLSGNENILIAFRILQGAGAGFVMPVGMAIITRVFPPKQRGIALGFWGIAAAASSSLGPLIGGYLVDNFSWHSIFDINIPIGIMGIVAAIIIQDEYKSHIKQKFDIAGFLTMTIGLGSLLLALATGNSDWNTGGWHSTFIVSNFFIAAACLIAFVMIELRIKHPILNLRLLRHYNFAISNIIMFIFGIAFFGNVFLLPIYLQNSLGYTAFQAGLVFFPVGFLQAFISPVAGQITDRFNGKIPLLVGAVVLGISMYLFSFLSLNTTHAQIMFPLYLRGLGLGLIFTPISVIALLGIPNHELAQASGLFNTIRQVGGSFGIAILGTILTARVKFHTQIYGEQLNQTSPVFHNVTNHLKEFAMHAVGSNHITAFAQAKIMLFKNIVAQAFAQGISNDFYIGTALSFILVIPMFFLKTRKKHSNR